MVYQRMSRATQPRLPLAPLLRRSGLDRAVITGVAYGTPGSMYDRPAPQTLLAEMVGVNLRTISRWARDGIPLSAADDAACALGLHPTEVWPGYLEVVA